MPFSMSHAKSNSPGCRSHSRRVPPSPAPRTRFPHSYQVYAPPPTSRAPEEQSRADGENLPGRVVREHRAQDERRHAPPRHFATVVSGTIRAGSPRQIARNRRFGGRCPKTNEMDEMSRSSDRASGASRGVIWGRVYTAATSQRAARRCEGGGGRGRLMCEWSRMRPDWK